MVDHAHELWRSLDDVQKAQLLAGSFLCLSVFGIRGTALLGMAAAILAQKKPSTTSFQVFFERWFKDTFVPQMSARLSHELAERSRSNRSLFDILKDSAAAFVVENSRAMQTAVLWESVTTRSLPTLRFHDLLFMRVAVINLGSAAQPMPVSFWGVYDQWFLSPLMRLDFDGVSVLQALEGRDQ